MSRRRQKLAFPRPYDFRFAFTLKALILDTFAQAARSIDDPRLEDAVQRTELAIAEFRAEREKYREQQKREGHKVIPFDPRARLCLVAAAHHVPVNDVLELVPEVTPPGRRS